LLPVSADHQRRFLLLFLFLVLGRAHRLNFTMLLVVVIRSDQQDT
jgi:hypothetical protein